ncbi:MAG: hypothetical protein AB7S38_29640 [Vulcanimicrobiota bacterium]
MRTVGIRRPGDGWFYILRDRFYFVWLSTLVFCLIAGIFRWEDLFYLGFVLFLALCPVGLSLAVLYLYRNVTCEYWAYDLELGQVLRVANWPARYRLVARVDELTEVVVAAEETAAVWVADGSNRSAEQVVYLLRGLLPPLAVSRTKFSERLLVGPDGRATFLAYDYNWAWLRAAMGLGVSFSWPALLLGGLTLPGFLMVGY